MKIEVKAYDGLVTDTFYFPGDAGRKKQKYVAGRRVLLQEMLTLDARGIDHFMRELNDLKEWVNENG